MDWLKVSSYLKRGIIYIFGISFMALGISLTIKAELGTGAWPALFVGLFNTFGLTVGTWTFIIGLFLIVMNAILLKERMNLLCLIPMFILGSFIDLYLLVIFRELFWDGLLIQSLILTVSLIIFSFGLATYLQAKFASIPIDGFMIAVQRRFNKSLGKAKTFIELFALFFAFLFSGPIGVGTIVFTFLSGPCTQFFYKKVSVRLEPFLFKKQVENVNPVKKSL